MSLDSTRRDFLHFLELFAAAGLLTGVASAQGVTMPSNATQQSLALQSVADYLKSSIQSINMYSGPQLSASYGPTKPYIPQQEPEYELEGLVYPEDYPPDYMNFNPQTGLFDNITID